MTALLTDEAVRAATLQAALLSTWLADPENGGTLSPDEYEAQVLGAAFRYHATEGREALVRTAALAVREAAGDHAFGRADAVAEAVVTALFGEASS
jgi:hypothetical protein